LKLSDGDSRYAIPVRVVKGFPVALAQLIDQYREPIHRLLAHRFDECLGPRVH
jgi:hypothetical protein